MIVCTKSVDTLCKKGFGKQNVSVFGFDKIVEFLAIDPALQEPTKDAFIVSAEDLRNPRARKAFEAVLTHKHPGVFLVLIARDNKVQYGAGSGIDLVLVSPKPDALASVVNDRVLNITKKVMAHASDQPPMQEQIQSSEYMPTQQPVQEQAQQFSSDEALTELPVYQPEEYAPTSTPESPRTPNMVDRINSCECLASVATLSNELHSAQVIKELIRDNQQFASLEDKLRGLQEKINSVMISDEYPDLETKLEKIRSICYDKEFYKSRTNPIVVQYVEEIIRTITGKTLEFLYSRLAELDKALVHRKSIREEDLNLTRLAGIRDERANILLELCVMDKEIRAIYDATDGLMVETTEEIIDSVPQMTESAILDAHLRMRGMVSTEKSLDDAITILSTAERTDPQFEQAIQDINVMKKKLHQLLNLDKEKIAVLNEIISYMTSNKVEDTIVANTLLKKSLRLYVGEEGVGTTSVPLIKSYDLSRRGGNVLLLNLTGFSKYGDYGQNTETLESWLETRAEKPFHVVVHDKELSIEEMQRLSTALTKSALYYPCINIVVSPSQMNLIEFFQQDALSINYIVDPSKPVLARAKELIKETNYDNVAQRIIANKCSVPIVNIIDALDVRNRIDVHIVRADYSPNLVDCSYKQVLPYMVNAVMEIFKEVTENA